MTMKGRQDFPVLEGEKERLRKDRPCTVCERRPTVYVEERIPGSQGRMAQSFAGRYRLCHTCLRKAQHAGAVESDHFVKHLNEKRYRVLAKTFAWLRVMRGSTK